MRCPHADSATRIYAEKNGDLLCSECHGALGIPTDKPVRTNKKIWAGSQVDGADKNKEKIHNFGEKIAARAEKNRRRFNAPQNPVLRERLGFTN